MNNYTKYYPKSEWKEDVLKYCELPLDKPQYIKIVCNRIYEKNIKLYNIFLKNNYTKYRTYLIIKTCDNKFKDNELFKLLFKYIPKDKYYYNTIRYCISFPDMSSYKITKSDIRSIIKYFKKDNNVNNYLDVIPYEILNINKDKFYGYEINNILI